MYTNEINFPPHLDILLKLKWEFFRVIIRNFEVENETHPFSIIITLKKCWRIEWYLRMENEEMSKLDRNSISRTFNLFTERHAGYLEFL